MAAVDGDRLRSSRRFKRCFEIVQFASLRLDFDRCCTLNRSRNVEQSTLSRTREVGVHANFAPSSKMPGQHSKDKTYMTSTEWQDLGGFKEKRAGQFKRLPFDCCSLAFTQWSTPVATISGAANTVHIFDFMNLVPFIRKHAKHPVSGEPLAGKDIIKLSFTKNNDGQYMCPITHKVFNEHSRIVFVRHGTSGSWTGNVFSYEAVESLNIQTKSWKDLLTDEPFVRADIFWIQDPLNPDWVKAHDVSAFHHVKAGTGTASTAGLAGASEAANSGGGTIRLSDSSRRVLAELEQKSTAAAAAQKRGREEDGDGSSSSTGGAGPLQEGHVKTMGVKTSGQFTGSFTSTGMRLTTSNAAATETDEDKRERRWKGVAAMGRKAYCRINTSAGAVNVELHADLVPRTVDNFIQLSKRGYYNNVIFHRNIKNFMIQGGDPTGTGRGGECLWKQQYKEKGNLEAKGKGFDFSKGFKDEFHQKLSHSERGILSMANSGPNSNGSQFFITFKSCPHLDRKHSIFGRVVGGLDVLRALELSPTNPRDDRPTKDIKIVSVEVFQDPFADYEQKVEKDAASGVASSGAGGASSAVSQRNTGAGTGFVAGSTYSRAAPGSAEAEAAAAAARATAPVTPAFWSGSASAATIAAQRQQQQPQPPTSSSSGPAVPNVATARPPPVASASSGGGPSLTQMLSQVGTKGSSSGGAGGSSSGSGAASAASEPIQIGKYINRAALAPSSTSAAAGGPSAGAGRLSGSAAAGAGVGAAAGSLSADQARRVKLLLAAEAARTSLAPGTGTISDAGIGTEAASLLQSTAAAQSSAADAHGQSADPGAAKRPRTTGFGDFSGW